MFSMLYEWIHCFVLNRFLACLMNTAVDERDVKLFLPLLNANSLGFCLTKTQIKTRWSLHLKTSFLQSQKHTNMCLLGENIHKYLLICEIVPKKKQTIKWNCLEGTYLLGGKCSRKEIQILLFIFFYHQIQTDVEMKQTFKRIDENEMKWNAWEKEKQTNKAKKKYLLGSTGCVPEVKKKHQNGSHGVNTPPKLPTHSLFNYNW